MPSRKRVPQVANLKSIPETSQSVSLLPSIQQKSLPARHCPLSTVYESSESLQQWSSKQRRQCIKHKLTQANASKWEECFCQCLGRVCGPEPLWESQTGLLCSCPALEFGALPSTGYCQCVSQSRVTGHRKLIVHMITDQWQV